MDSNVLLEANGIINGERQTDYGDPAMTLGRIAEQWSLYLRQNHGIKLMLNAEDICWMMSDLKKVRHMAGKKRDNLVDAAGYIGLIDRL